MKRFDLVAQPSPSQDDRIYGKRKYCFSPDAAILPPQHWPVILRYPERSTCRITRMSWKWMPKRQEVRFWEVSRCWFVGKPESQPAGGIFVSARGRDALQRRRYFTAHDTISSGASRGQDRVRRRSAQFRCRNQVLA